MLLLGEIGMVVLENSGVWHFASDLISQELRYKRSFATWFLECSFWRSEVTTCDYHFDVGTFQMCCWKHQLEGLFRWRCLYPSLTCGCLFTRISDHLLCMLLREYRSQNGYTTVEPRKLPSSLWKRKLIFPTTERDMLVWIVGIQSPSKNGTGTFQWLDTPIIPWQYDWVPGAGSSSPPQKITWHRKAWILAPWL